MGIQLVDSYSMGHFMIGLLSFPLLSKFKLPIYTNFLLSNGLHLYIEFIENNTTLDGKILETNKNHIGDIICFLIGWGIGYFYNISIPDYLFLFVFFFVVFVTYKEITQELFPYRNSIFVKGRFVPNVKLTNNL
jgi:hypothetical protein